MGHALRCFLKLIGYAKPVLDAKFQEDASGIPEVIDGFGDGRTFCKAALDRLTGREVSAAAFQWLDLGWEDVPFHQCSCSGGRR